MEATLKGAAYGLSQRQIIAQTEGPVQDIYFRDGEYVPAVHAGAFGAAARQCLCALLRAGDRSSPKVKLGQKVQHHLRRLQADMTATITFIAAQDEFTPPVIFSVGNREKLVFKLEARAPGGLNINPGQPVDVRPL